MEDRKKVDARIFNKFVDFQGDLTKFDTNVTLEHKQAVVDTFLAHIDVMCGNERDTCRDFLIDWLAHLIQHPQRKEEGGICVLFKSKPGAGKGIFWTFFGRHVVGKKYYRYFNKLEQITENFDALMANSLLHFLDEIQNYGGAFAKNDYLKSIITESEMIRENKNVDPASSRNYARYVMATNNDWPAKVEIGDRRYFCLEMSISKIGDTDYINHFVQLMHNDIAGKIIYEYLLNRKITWNPRHIPMTAFRQDLMNRSAPNINSFFEYLGSDEYEEPPTPLVASFMPPHEDGWIVEKPKNIFTQYATWFKQNHCHQSQFCDSKTFRKALDDLVT